MIGPCRVSAGSTYSHTGGKHGRIVPRRLGDEVMQGLVQAGNMGRVEARRHRLDALALAGQQKAVQ